MHEMNDTIAAVSTAMGNAGIGIVRISGKDAFSIASKIFKPANKNKKIEELPGYTVHYGKIVDDGEILDEVLLVLLRAPRSYTAEDTVEIDSHGGRLIIQKILELVIKNGARPADPGEFTKRAYLNGRIDLSQAEAVMDLIQAESDYALKSSVSQLQGSVRKKIENIREKILYENAYLEAALDDPEHISLDGFSERLYKVVDDLKEETGKLIKTADNGKILREGIRTVIVGKPNAGKSTLMNALLGSDRAIVTEVEGTTRDILEEQIRIGDISITLTDTAGIRNTDDPVEKIGVKKAKDQIEEADLVLFVADSSVPIDERDGQILKLLENKKVLTVLNKSDLPAVTTAEEIRRQTCGEVIEISAKHEDGIKELGEKIRSLFFKENINFNDEVIITNARQKKYLCDALKSLEMVEKAIDDGIPEDFYSIDLTDAYTSFGYILGEETGEDLIDEIFEKFCLGK